MNPLLIGITLLLWVGTLGAALLGYLEGKLKDRAKLVVILFVLALVFTVLTVLMGGGGGQATMN
jgi:MFS-type transporter involved in bile tolerance (Atg22 family)